MNCIQYSEPTLSVNQSAHFLAWYCFGLTYRTALRSTNLCRSEGKALRAKLLGNSKLPELKLDVLRYANSTLPSKKKKEIFDCYSEDNRRLIFRLLEMKAYDRIWSYTSCMDEVPTFEQLQRECEKTFAEGKVMQSAIGFSRRKLSFLYKSNNLAHTDYASELMVKAVQTYYYYRPISSIEYALNCVRQAMHHVGINIINIETDESKSRLIATGGGFENRVRAWQESDDMPISFSEPKIFSKPLDEKVYQILTGQSDFNWPKKIASKADAINQIAFQLQVPPAAVEASLNSVKDYVFD